MCAAYSGTGMLVDEGVMFRLGCLIWVSTHEPHEVAPNQLVLTSAYSKAVVLWMRCATLSLTN